MTASLYQSGSSSSMRLSFRLRTSTSDYGLLPTADCGLRTADGLKATSDYGLRTADGWNRLRTADGWMKATPDCGLRTPDGCMTTSGCLHGAGTHPEVGITN